jgi:hypothetical protein
VDLKPQEPAEGIYAQRNYPGFESYTIPCSCGNADDNMEIIVEEEHGEVSVQTYTLQKTAWWIDRFDQHKSYDIKNEFLFQLNYYIRGFLNALWHRCKVTWAVWVHGNVEYHQTAILTPQQALNFSETLKNSVIRVQAYQEQIRQEKNGTL